LGGTCKSRLHGFCGGDAFVVASGSPITRPFALPRKRFTKKPVLERANAYLATDQAYSKVVEHEGMPIMYDDRTEARGKKLVGLAPSTVWRWLSLLGEMRHGVHAAIRRIREKQRDFLLNGELCLVSSGKYRSRRRRDILHQAKRVFMVDRACARLFGKGIFPRYEMPQGWS
jgi:hypothetical protein